ncbi:hypothetical protein T08_6257, partial [Trichinella sp. T8]
MSGSSEYTVILSVMYHSNVSGRSSELRALLIAGFIRRIRERKETIEQLNILYLPITFGVSEKRLLGQMLDEMLSDTPPR